MSAEPLRDQVAEQSVLGAVLLSGAPVLAGVQAAGLRPEDFHDHRHETIYRAMLALADRGEPADKVTVPAELGAELARVGGLVYLHTLLESVPSAANAGHYARIVRGHADRRRLLAVANRLQAAALSGDGHGEALGSALGEMNALAECSPEIGAARRSVVAKPMTAYATRRTRWLWDGRWPLGEISLVAGKGDLGKSTIVLNRAAELSRGALDGEYLGQPRDVLLCATEDDIGATIKPRLVAAGADLSRVHAIEVVEADGGEGWLFLPADLVAVAELAIEKGAALVVLDPLISRLPGSMDTHKDADVRRALEPLRRMARDAEASIVGLIHTNKGMSTDPASAVMGSAGFVNVARSVSICVADPDDESNRERLFGTVKNNLGRGDLPTLRYHLIGATVEAADGDTAEVGMVIWDGEAETTVRQAMSQPMGGESRSLVGDGARWLGDHLRDQGGGASRESVIAAGRLAGFSESTLKRARSVVGVEVENTPTKPRRTLWILPGSSSRSSQLSQSSRTSGSGEEEAELTADPTEPIDLTGLTELTGPTGDDLRLSHDSSPETVCHCGRTIGMHRRGDVGACTICGREHHRFGPEGLPVCASCEVINAPRSQK